MLYDTSRSAFRIEQVGDHSVSYHARLLCCLTHMLVYGGLDGIATCFSSFVVSVPLGGKFGCRLPRKQSLNSSWGLRGYRKPAVSERLPGCEVVNPNFRLYDVIVSDSKMRMFRGLGWAANNGGGHFEANTSASNSFIRSTDDLIKVRDGDIATDNMVLWQSYNGGTFQLGWAGLHLVNITHRAASVIENEWRAPDDWEKYDTRPNNAVVSLVDSKSADPAALVGPFVWQDLQIDGDVSHPLSLRLENGVLGNVLFDGLTISGNVTRFAFATATKGKATIANVTFRNFTIAGQSQSHKMLAATFGPYGCLK